MDFQLISILIGAGFVCWMVSYAAKSLLANRDNQKSVVLTAAVVVGWIGVGLIIWGLVVFIGDIT